MIHLLLILTVGGTDVSQEASENAAMFLLQHFKNSDHVTGADTKILKDNFGPFPARNAEKCCEIVQKLLNLLPHGALDSNKNSYSLNSKRYGHKLKVNIVDEEEFMLDDSDSDFEIDKGDRFVDKFKEQLTLDHAKQYTDMFNVQPARNSPEYKQEQETESSWLFNQCQVYFPGHESPETMATALYDVLISTKNDAEIQNELFELVGFDAFDFIGELLKRRKELTSSQHITSSMKSRNSSKKPLVASQVTIQVDRAFISYMIMHL